MSRNPPDVSSPRDERGRMPDFICLVRHGFSTKNAQDRHGGTGRLTQRGMKEIKVAGLRIRHRMPLKHGPVRIYSSDFPQTLDSAKVIAQMFEKRVIVDRQIRPQFLGILDGLSTNEALRKFPNAAKRMEEWRVGEREISTLNIKGAEVIDHFWQRGMEFIEKRSTQREFSIVIGTRSILGLLANLLLGHTTKLGGGYRAIILPTGGVACFKRNSRKWKLFSEELWDAQFVHLHKKKRYTATRSESNRVQV